MNNIQTIINKRYSARYFDKSKTIDPILYDLIIDAGLKSPSGFGSEPWKFIKIKGDRSKILDSGMKQQAFLDSSELLIVLYVKEKYIIDNPQFLDKFKLIYDDETKSDYIINFVKDKAKTNYFKEQCMFAAGQMVLQATDLGIDSLLMGGFNEETLAQDLKIDTEHYGIALVIAFGYNLSKGETKPKRTAQEVVTEINL